MHYPKESKHFFLKLFCVYIINDFSKRNFFKKKNITTYIYNYMYLGMKTLCLKTKYGYFECNNPFLLSTSCMLINLLLFKQMLQAFKRMLRKFMLKI